MSHQIASPRTYIIVFVALLVLLVLTVAAAEIDHATTAIVVALGIAVVKAVLIVIFFMNVRFNNFITRVFVACGFLWLGLLISFTLADYLSRAWP